MVKVIVLEPGGRYRPEEASTLEDFQRLVGGNIEHTSLDHLPGCEGLHLWSNEDSIGLDLDPNLWSLPFCLPLLGPLVLFREQGHGQKVDVTDADRALVASLATQMREHLVKLGLYPPEPHGFVMSWPEKTPDDLQPGP
jgi:hypothetical protein